MHQHTFYPCRERAFQNTPLSKLVPADPNTLSVLKRQPDFAPGLAPDPQHIKVAQTLSSQISNNRVGFIGYIPPQ